MQPRLRSRRSRQQMKRRCEKGGTERAARPAARCPIYPSGRNWIAEASPSNHPMLDSYIIVL